MTARFRAALGRAGVLVCALLAVLPAAALDDEIVREFRKYFRKYKDTETRVEAVLALEGTESPAVVEVLLPILKGDDPEVQRAAIRVLSGFETGPPIEALLASLESEKSEAVRIGLLRVLGEARYPGSVPALGAVLGDRSWEVRRHAVVALGRSGEPAVADQLVPLCTDGEAAVRAATLDALAELGSRAVLDPALSSLTDESWQVRASALGALGRVRDKRSIEPLIGRLEAEEGRLREDAARALEAVTGRRFGLRLESWRKFWNTWKDRYEIPTDEELARLRKKEAETAQKYRPTGVSTYHGVATPSRRIIFVIDVSGSMEQEVSEREQFAEGDYPSWQRIDIVKTELARTVERLEPWVEFNILAFATEVRAWKKGLVKANVLNKSSADSWIGRLEALGGNSKKDLARAGLRGSANLEAGKTNTHAALLSALGVDEGRGGEYEVEVDTIFFLSDGRPSHGYYTDPQDILRAVREVNALRRIVIHTIGIGEYQRGFMQSLADQNGGVFVDLGK